MEGSPRRVVKKFSRIKVFPWANFSIKTSTSPSLPEEKIFSNIIFYIWKKLLFELNKYNFIIKNNLKPFIQFPNASGKIIPLSMENLKNIIVALWRFGNLIKLFEIVFL